MIDACTAQPHIENQRVLMLRPHLRDIPDYAFPAGFALRPMQVAEEGIWTEIHREAERYVPVTDDALFRAQFGADLDAVPERCFFMVNAAGFAVGTISAWYDRDFRGQEYGRIHWVAIRPSHQGQGLAKPALSAALYILARRHDRCYLSTSSARIPALNLYLNFGFLPDLTLPDAPEIWRQVQAVLPHPALTSALQGE